jgi:hypothetical protein
VFRLAYRSLLSQQRPEGEAAAVNGTSFHADKADAPPAAGGSTTANDARDNESCMLLSQIQHIFTFKSPRPSKYFWIAIRKLSKNP